MGLGLGAFIGAFQGFIIAYIGVPSFIVTLGGLLALRGVVWIMSGGRVSRARPDVPDPRRRGPQGSIGGELTWALGHRRCVAIVGLLIYNRRQRPSSASRCARCGPRCCSARSRASSWRGVFANATTSGRSGWPTAVAWSAASADPPGGLKIDAGIPWPDLLLVGVAIVMSFLANRRRFGRYVYAIGGNPEAAELAGINTRWTILKTFVLMGVLCALGAAICGPAEWRLAGRGPWVRAAT